MKGHRIHSSRPWLRLFIALGIGLGGGLCAVRIWWAGIPLIAAAAAAEPLMASRHPLPGSRPSDRTRLMPHGNPIPPQPARPVTFRLINRTLRAPGNIVGEYATMDEGAAFVLLIASKAGWYPTTDLILNAWSADGTMVEHLVGTEILQRAGLDPTRLPKFGEGPQLREGVAMMQPRSTEDESSE